MATSDKGILYVAIGESMREPLERSIASVREHLDLPVTLVTDLADPPSVDACRLAQWRERPGYAVKPAFIPQLPYERTLYLDTDTVVLSREAANPLDLITRRYGYHAAAVHGVSRRFQIVDHELMCVPSLNSGVLFLRNSALVQSALSLWQRYYPGHGSEEVHLTRALLQRRVPMYCLPCEWNYRGLGLRDWQSIRIVHRKSFFTPVDSWWSQNAG